MITGRLPAGLSKVILTSASVCLISVSASRADYLSHRSPALVFATEKFDEPWVPRKGKMSYEQDAAQPDYGQGTKGTVHQATCAQLPGIVGPAGKARDGDIIVITSKGSCKLSGLTIHKAVTIRPSGTPGPVVTDLKDAGLDAAARKYELDFDCGSMTTACITANVAPGKMVTIRDINIHTDSLLDAPLIESRSGGLTLINNLISGAMRTNTDGDILGFELSAAVLIHGSQAVLKNNLIVHSSVGVMLIPTQISKKSNYTLSGNTITRVDVGVLMDGTVFTSSDGPMVKITLAGNNINPGLDEDIASSFNPPEPGHDTILGYGGIGVPQYGVLARRVNLTLSGNSFGTSDIHVELTGSKAFLDKNLFRHSHQYSIYIIDGTQVSINRNLFDDNQNVIYGIGYAFADNSPYPAGNICVNQTFASFYRGPSHVTGYVDVNAFPPSFAYYADEKKKVSRSAISKSRRRNPDLWAAFEDTGEIFTEGKTSGSPYVELKSDSSAREKKAKSKTPDYMWDVFRTFYEKGTEPVVAHVLFDRKDVKPGDEYRACFDYSTLYKFDKPDDWDDDLYLSP